MWRNFIIISLTLLLLISCSEKKEEISNDIVSTEKLTQILLDLHLTDGILNAYNNENQVNIFLSDTHYNKNIFLKYACTDSAFKMSVKHYTMNGKIKEIYTVVLDSLNTMKGKIEQDRQRKSKARKQATEK